MRISAKAAASSGGEACVHGGKILLNAFSIRVLLDSLVESCEVEESGIDRSAALALLRVGTTDANGAMCSLPREGWRPNVLSCSSLSRGGAARPISTAAAAELENGATWPLEQTAATAHRPSQLSLCAQLTVLRIADALLAEAP